MAVLDDVVVLYSSHCVFVCSFFLLLLLGGCSRRSENEAKEL